MILVELGLLLVVALTLVVIFVVAKVLIEEVMVLPWSLLENYLLIHEITMCNWLYINKYKEKKLAILQSIGIIQSYKTRVITYTPADVLVGI